MFVRTLVFWLQQWGRLTSQSLLNLLEYNDPDLDASLGGSLEHVVQPVFVVLCRRATQVKLRRQPPVQDENSLLGL